MAVCHGIHIKNGIKILYVSHFVLLQSSRRTYTNHTALHAANQQLWLHCLFWLMELNKLCSLENKAITFPNVCTSKAFVPFLSPSPAAGVKYNFELSLTRVLYGPHICLALFMFLNIFQAWFPLIQSCCCRFVIMTSQWAPCLKSPASRLLAQQFVQAHIKEDIKSPRHWPLW